MKNVNSIFPTVSAYILFSIYFLVWFHQFDCGGGGDDGDDNEAFETQKSLVSRGNQR
jgi:hypothetical protein